MSWRRRWYRWRRRAWRATPSWAVDLAYIVVGLTVLALIGLVAMMVLGGFDIGLHPGRRN